MNSAFCRIFLFPFALFPGSFSLKESTVKMAAPKKNTYWKLAKGFPSGSDRKYTPQELWDKAVDYFKWVEDNPLLEEKLFGTGLKDTVKKMRAMTIIEFCVFAGIARSTFQLYEKDEAYSVITARIRDIIYDQKFTGAAAGLLESNIIARELGLVDKKDVTTKGQNVTASPLNDLPTEALLEIEQIAKKYGK